MGGKIYGDYFKALQTWVSQSPPFMFIPFGFFHVKCTHSLYFSDSASHQKWILWDASESYCVSFFPCTHFIFCIHYQRSLFYVCTILLRMAGSVLSAVSDGQWWKKTLRTFKSDDQLSSDANSDMEKQGCHPFYADAIANSFQDKVSRPLEDPLLNLLA